MLAPICLFTYCRLSETINTVKALQQNYLASSSELFIFSDGGKDESSWDKVNALRLYLKQINGFKSVTIFESTFNQGLATSIIKGVSKIMDIYGKAIVIEDDLISSSNFLDFMNQCLDMYENNSKIFAVSGYSYPLRYRVDHIYDVSFGYRSYPWGWATWKSRWKEVDWDVSDYSIFKKSRMQQRSFNRGGSDLSSMLHKQMAGQLDSWMIRWVYHQYKHDMYDVFPKVSKIINNGFTKEATHTSSCSPLRYVTPLDQSNNRVFELPECVTLDNEIVKQFQSKLSLTRRIKYRLFDILGISNLLIRFNLIQSTKPIFKE